MHAVRVHGLEEGGGGVGRQPAEVVRVAALDLRVRMAGVVQGAAKSDRRGIGPASHSPFVLQTDVVYRDVQLALHAVDPINEVFNLPCQIAFRPAWPSCKSSQTASKYESLMNQYAHACCFAKWRMHCEFA